MYVIYMDMHHNTVDGKQLLVRAFVAKYSTHHHAKVERQHHSQALSTPNSDLRKLSDMIIKLNPQAGSIQTMFPIAFED